MSAPEAVKDQKPPFANLYEVKHVADNACKACVVCYKPTNTVLITPSKKDWFYICGVHLKDKNFAKLVYCDDTGRDTESEWKKLCNSVEGLQWEWHKIEIKEKDELAKEQSWLKVIPSWGGKKVEKEKTKEGEEKADTSTGDENKKEGRSKEAISSELKESERQLAAFERENIKYRLEKVFYRGRLLQDFKRKKQAEIEQKLASGTLFPNLDGLASLKN